MVRIIYREDKWGQGFLLASLLHWILIMLLLWAWVSYQRSSTDAQDKFCLIIDKAPLVFKIPTKAPRRVYTKAPRPRPKPIQHTQPAQKVQPTQKAEPKVVPRASIPQDIQKSDYLSELIYQIEVAREYPPQSIRYGEEGIVGVRFRIQPDGDLTDIGVQKTSGYPRLDQSALEAIGRAAPYKPIPAEYFQRLRQQGRTNWPVSVNIQYSLKTGKK